MAGALEPRYGTNALSRRARVLPAQLATSGSLANGPVGRPSRIGSRVAPSRGCRLCDKLSPSHVSPSQDEFFPSPESCNDAQVSFLVFDRPLARPPRLGGR